MPGFNNGVMYASNVRFDGAAYPGEVTADGQLLIGSTAAPNIRVNTLTPGTGVSITNGPGTIEISAVGSGMTTLEISVDTTLASNTCYLVEDNLGTGLPLNLTLPASPVIGDVIEIISYRNMWVLVGPDLHFVTLGGNPYGNNTLLGGSNHGTVTSLFHGDVIRLRFCGTIPGHGGFPNYYMWVAEDVIGNIHFYNDTMGDFTTNSVGISGVGIPYYDGVGIFSSISTTQYAPLVGDALNNIASVGPLADGEILIGSTGNNPVPATLTQGSNITITPAPGSITISATTPPGITAWSKISADQPAVVGQGYFCDKAGLLSLSLPATAAIGDVIEVANINTALGITITQGANQVIYNGIASTTPGIAGSISSSALGDTLKLVCRTVDLEWQVVSVIGNWIIV